MPARSDALEEIDVRAEIVSHDQLDDITVGDNRHALARMARHQGFQRIDGSGLCLPDGLALGKCARLGYIWTVCHSFWRRSALSLAPCHCP